ncbi:MAG: D-glycerate dehydrogenase [bacterium]|nr:D-glycerate dehydrogenase [bacterium]
MKQRVFITRPIPAPEELKKLFAKFDVVANSKPGALSRDELKKKVKGVHAIFSLLTDRIDEEVMEAAGSQLKIIANYAVGFDNIDLLAAKKRGIVVTNTPGPETSEAVAEHAMTLICALARHIVEADRFTRAEEYHGWLPNLFLGVLLRGKTLGIVGLGRIGLILGQIAAAGFGMKVLYSDPRHDREFEKQLKARRVNLHALLKQSDFVSLHVPLLPSTRHLMSTKEFALMKPAAHLINTARGPVVDEKALLKALTRKQIAGAALDVFECEPTIDCDIRDNLELKKIPNVILTPHIASATIEVRRAMARVAVANIVAVLSGKKPLTPAS